MKIKLIKFKSVKSTNDIAIKLIRKEKVQPTLIFLKSKQKEEEQWVKNGYLKKEIYLYRFSLK